MELAESSPCETVSPEETHCLRWLWRSVGWVASILTISDNCMYAAFVSFKNKVPLSLPRSVRESAAL